LATIITNFDFDIFQKLDYIILLLF